MVDALHEATRIIRRGGMLVDARPDSRVLARVEHSGRLVGAIRTHLPTRGDDIASDRALAVVLQDGELVSRRAGRFWHRHGFTDLEALRAYLRGHPRFDHRVQWSPPARLRHQRWAADPFVLVRPVRFEVLERRAAIRRA